MSSLLFYDPLAGEQITYEDFLSIVDRPEVSYAPAVRPDSAGAAVIALLSAVVLGQELILFDADFSHKEMAALGGSDALLAQRNPVAGTGCRDLATLLKTSRSERGFLLTLFTSGSTGMPRKVTHRLGALTRTLRTGPKHAENTWGLAYDPTHIAGVQVILQAFFNGNPLINLFQADRASVRRAIVRHTITHLSATPSFYRLLLPVDEPLRGVRAVTLGGERSDTVLLGRLKELFPSAKIRNLYASTEAGTLLVSEGDVFGIANELCGKIRITNSQLEVHCSLVGKFEGGEPMEWYKTGDIVEVVSEEPLRFRILSRDRDWVNVGGHKVNPGEVEDALLAYPTIVEARVYGRPNSILGQILCAEVVTTGDFAEPAVRAYLAGCLQPSKVPRLIKQVDALSRTRTGKVSRT